MQSGFFFKVQKESKMWKKMYVELREIGTKFYYSHWEIDWRIRLNPALELSRIQLARIFEKFWKSEEIFYVDNLTSIWDPSYIIFLKLTRQFSFSVFYEHYSIKSWDDVFLSSF